MAESSMTIHQLCSKAGVQSFSAEIAKEAATIPELAALSEDQLVTLGMPALRARKLLSLCQTYKADEPPTRKRWPSWLRTSKTQATSKPQHSGKEQRPSLLPRLLVLQKSSRTRKSESAIDGQTGSNPAWAPPRAEAGSSNEALSLVERLQAFRDAPTDADESLCYRDLMAGLRAAVTTTASNSVGKESGNGDEAVPMACSARSPRSQPPPLHPGTGRFPLGSMDSGSSGPDPSVVVDIEAGSTGAKGTTAKAGSSSSPLLEPRASSVPRLDSSSSSSPPLLTSSPSSPLTSSSSSPPSLTLPPPQPGSSSSSPPRRPTVSGPRPPPPQSSSRSSHGLASAPLRPPSLPSPASAAELLRGESEPRSPSSRAGCSTSSALLQPSSISSSSTLAGSEATHRSIIGIGSALVLKAPPPRGARGARQESKAPRPPPPPLLPSSAVPPPPPFKLGVPSKPAMKRKSSYCESGKNIPAGATEPPVDPRGRLHWKGTAEVKEIDHYNDLQREVHEALWYTNDEWDEMEQRNIREAQEEQMACEYGYARFKNGYYEYIGENSSSDEEEDDKTDGIEEGSITLGAASEKASAAAADNDEPESALDEDLSESPLKPIKATQSAK